MQYLDRSELRRLFQIAYDSNRINHLCLLTMFWSGLRVSEALAITGTDICDGQLSVKRLKKSKATLHTLKVTSEVLFDQSPLLQLAKENPGRLFPFSRQWVYQFMQKYGTAAGIHEAKLHPHSLKHAICVLLYQETHDLNAVQDWVGHKSVGSTLVYLRADGATKAAAAVVGLAL